MAKQEWRLNEETKANVESAMKEQEEAWQKRCVLIKCTANYCIFVPYAWPFNYQNVLLFSGDGGSSGQQTFENK